MWLAGDQHRERELGLLAAGERARVLEHDLAVQPEHPEQRPEVLVGFGAHVTHVREHVAARADAFVLLGVVAERDLMAERDRAEVGFELADERLEQRRLARAVEAEHEHALAAADIERDVFEHRLGAERLREVGDFECDPSGPRRLRAGARAPCVRRAAVTRFAASFSTR